MIFPGHLGAGFLTTYAVLAVAGSAGALGGLSPAEINTLLVAGTLLGDAPDVDILFYFFQKKTLGPGGLSGHRRYLTHAPLLWLVAGLGIFFASSFFAPQLGQTAAFWNILGLLVWFCPWSHFVCDSIDCGIMWLWPFSKKQFALLDSQAELDARHTAPPAHWRGLFSGYLKNPVAYVEILVTFIAVYVFLTRLL